MSWLEFISSIIKSVAWPIIVLIAVLALRKPVSQLILKLAELKLKTVKYGEFEATFEDKLEDVESNVNPEGESVNSSVNDSEDVSFKNTDLAFVNIAEEAPHLAVAMAWQELEYAITNILIELGVYESLFVGVRIKRPPTAYQGIKYLNNNGYISDNFVKTFNDLHQLRRFAVHNHHDHLITYDEAIRYRKVTKRLIKMLQAATPETHSADIE